MGGGRPEIYGNQTKETEEDFLLGDNFGDFQLLKRTKYAVE